MGTEDRDSGVPIGFGEEALALGGRAAVHAVSRGLLQTLPAVKAASGAGDTNTLNHATKEIGEMPDPFGHRQ